MQNNISFCNNHLQSFFRRCHFSLQIVCNKKVKTKRRKNYTFKDILCKNKKSLWNSKRNSSYKFLHRFYHKPKDLRHEPRLICGNLKCARIVIKIIHTPLTALMWQLSTVNAYENQLFTFLTRFLVFLILLFFFLSFYF